MPRFASFILLSDPCFTEYCSEEAESDWERGLGGLTCNFVQTVLKIIKAKKQRLGLNGINLGEIVSIMKEIC